MYWRDFKDLMTEMGTIVGILIAIFCFLMILIVPIAALRYFYDKNRCEIAAQSFESFEYRLGLCMVKYNGKMIPIENIKIGKE